MDRWLLGAVLAALTLLAGCKYDRTGTGTIGGKYALVWVSADRFAFVPDKTNPFYFVRPDGSKIVPQAMYTDGGSIPRSLWAFRNYSPWTYGPAYLLHDWLFVAHDCGPAEYRSYTVASSAEVLAECMKTLMVSGKAPKSRLTLELIYDAVKTPVATRLWDAPSDCGGPTPMAVTGSGFAHGLLRTGPAVGPPVPQDVPTQRYRVDVDLDRPPPAD